MAVFLPDSRVMKEAGTEYDRALWEAARSSLSGIFFSGLPTKITTRLGLNNSIQAVVS